MVKRWKQLAQRGCGASILRDTQTWTRYCPEQPALGGPAWPGNWTGQPPEAPACPSHPVILFRISLCFYSAAFYLPQADNRTWYILLSDSLPSPFTPCICSHPHSMLMYVCCHPHSNPPTYTVNLQIVSERSYMTLTKALHLESNCQEHFDSIPAELQCLQITHSQAIISQNSLHELTIFRHYLWVCPQYCNKET